MLSNCVILCLKHTCTIKYIFFDHLPKLLLHVLFMLYLIVHMIVHIVPHVPKIWFAEINWNWTIKNFPCEFIGHDNCEYCRKNTLHAICGFSILSAMLQSSNLHELTKKFKWTHKGVQMNPQRPSNDLQVARDIAIHRILKDRLSFLFNSSIPLATGRCMFLTAVSDEDSLPPNLI